jgi:peptidoglycan/xylan/chitin deacetylase (PgdA/CDA1 family)
MKFPGKKSLLITGRWLRSRATNSALILGYHRVAVSEDDIYLNCVRPQFFTEQLAVLREYANLLTIDELLKGLQANSLPPRTVVVTFDDGYADNLYQALPRLVQYEIPATVFVASGFLGSRFWWDKLADVLLDSDELSDRFSLELSSQTRTWRLSSLATVERKKVFQEVYQAFLGLSVQELRQAMDQLTQQLGHGSDDRCCSRALTHEELLTLSQCELLTIGAHTVNHPFLANLSAEEQLGEIGGCKAELEMLLGKPVTAFSYPHGSGNKETRTLVQEAGFTSACASYNDVVGSYSDLFNLPRFWAADQSGSKFKSWLHHWLSH